jgi:hypothetical protein
MYRLTLNTPIRDPTTTANDLARLLGVAPDAIEARLQRAPGVIGKTKTLQEAQRVQRAFAALGLELTIAEISAPPATQKVSSPPAPAPSDDRQITINARQLVGGLGALLLLIGVFVPLMSGPFGLTINYFNNGQGDGVIIAVLAIASMVSVTLQSYRVLWFTGAGALLLTTYTFTNLILGIDTVRRDLVADGDPFGVGSLAAASFQMQWGWVPLYVGGLLLLRAAAMGRR